MNLSQIYKVGRREYLTRVTSRAFIIMTVAVPLLLGLYMFSVPALTRPRNVQQHVAVIDVGTSLGTAVADRIRAIEQPRVLVDRVETVTSADAQARRSLNASLMNHDIDGYLVLERDTAAPVHVRYFGRETGNPILLRELRLAVQAAVLGRMLGGTGVDLADIRKTQSVDIDAVTVTDRGERGGGFAPTLVATLTMAMLLYIAVLINGQGMAMAIVEEKSSRLVEVILGAVTAAEFMTGKILGVLGSGVTQLAVWVAFALFALLQAVPVLASVPGGLDLTTVLNGRMIFYFAMFFALGFALYSVFFAIVAVTCTSTEEMTQSMFAASLPMVLAMVTSINAVTNPASPAVRVLSLIPFLTPLVMLARINVLMPPLWEVWLSIALLIATIFAVAWAAAKIFRYALLMTGKRPTLPELMAVVKAR